MSDAEVLFQALQPATTILKELVGLKLSRNVSTKVSEMNTVILSAQSSALAAQAREVELTDRVRKLEEEVVRLKDWDVNKQDYEIKSIGGTAFAYMIKESVETPEPKRWLCETCFNNSKESSFQRKSPPKVGRGWFWVCNSCGSDIRTDSFATPSNFE